LQILITNVLRGDADETERAEYDKKFADDERFRTLVEQIRGWLGPLEVKEEQNGPRPELLRSILDEIDASEKEK
jgi:anti-sigma-K factor RskA